MLSNSSGPLDPITGGNGTDQVGHMALLSFTLLYVFIIVPGFLLNAGALWVFSRHIRLRSGSTVYMRNLATADLLLVCFLPFRIVYYYRDGPYAKQACEITILIFLINMYTSIFLLACISLDRCIATLLPLRLPLHRLYQAAPWVSALVWVVSVGASLPAYLIWKRNNSSRHTNCLEPLAITKTVTVVFTLATGFGVPFTLLLVCSLLALRQVRKVQGTQLLKARKTQNMILANLLIFTFCFLPYHVLLCCYNELSKHSPVLAIQLFQAAQLLASSNAVLDPMLYYFCTEAFQKTHPVSTVCGVAACGCCRANVSSTRDRGQSALEAVAFISLPKLS